jgi:adenylate cyclase class 2
MEIEVKAKVEDLEEVKRKLIELGAEFTHSNQQDDSFFKPKGREMEDQGPGSRIIRIRKQEDRSFLTMKEMTDTSGVWGEHETEIGNPEETRDMLMKMDYSHLFDLNKVRENGKFDGMNLCLDDIKQLGKYLEVEIIGENHQEAKAKILELFQKIGINEIQIEHRGYARIISENMGIKFKGVK